MDITAIKQAQQRIKNYVKRTTLEHSETLSNYAVGKLRSIICALIPTKEKKYTHPDFVIKGGGHLMIFNKADEVNSILNEVLGVN